MGTYHFRFFRHEDFAALWALESFMIGSQIENYNYDDDNTEYNPYEHIHMKILQFGM